MAGPPPIFKTVNCEETFILASLQEFVKVWSSGHQASFNLNCENGRAWLSLGFQLGTPSSPHHLGVGHPPPTHLHGSVPRPYHRPRPKSLARRVRDRARAARHQKAQATVAQAATSRKFSETNSSLSAAAAPANQSCPPLSTPPVASTGQPDLAQAATACTPGAPPLARARPVLPPPSSTPPVDSTGQPDPAQVATACIPGAPPLARARPVPSPPPPTQHLPVLPAGLRPQPSAAAGPGPGAVCFDELCPDRDYLAHLQEQRQLREDDIRKLTEKMNYGFKPRNARRPF